MLNPRTLSELMSKNIDKDLYPTIFMMTSNGILLSYSTPAHVPTLRHQAALVGDTWTKLARSLSRTSSSQNPASTSTANSRVKSPSSPLARPQPNTRFNTASPLSYDPTAFNTDTATVSSALRDGDLDSVSLHIGSRNLLVRAIQPGLLLVMVGASAAGSGDAALGAAHEIVGSLDRESAVLRPPSVQSISRPPDAASLRSYQSGEVDGIERDLGQESEQQDGENGDSDGGKEDEGIAAELLKIQRAKLDRLAAYIKREFERDGFVMPAELYK